MAIREETAEDFAAIAALNRAAFGGEYEVKLVDKLRAANLFVLSLVTEDGDELCGHILFSVLRVEIDGRKVNAAALAPMAVSSARRNQGIGSRLVREGLRRLGGKGIEAVFVLGHTDYYPRFGFSAADAAAKFVSPFQGMPHFMALELVARSLSGENGSVVYPDAFGIKS
jgi:putative acetyltransferase